MTLYDDNTNFALADPTSPTRFPHRVPVKWVFDPDGVEPPFAYSVGLAARPGRAYELATTGLPDRVAYAVITGAADQLVADGLDPADGMELDEVLEGGYVVRLWRVTDTSRCTAARAESGPDVAVWQVLVPDKWGHFPGDPHYAEADAQPLM
ncbi:DUF4262 domain-containing protein [Streptomyces rimosus]|uniref:DUF4262 domain-containing protein n=1 Tax=Streptomyces rimosus TaxID=1927 RepID=UPI0004C1A2D9|nr:DUF4262 domain-containing protein [Streptomyces rimosus]